MTETTWELDLRDDVAGLTHPEDGSEYTYSVFYVTATNARGQRFAHKVRFHSAETYSGSDEDGWYGGIKNTLQETREKAQRFLDRVKASQAAGKWTTPVGNQYWEEIDPVYGSAEYIRQEPEIVAREREADKALPF